MSRKRTEKKPAPSASFLITSPNSTFTRMAQSVCGEFHFSAVIVEAVLEKAVERIRKYCRASEVVAIISRGATAAMLQHETSIPILVAGPNDFDLLTSIMDAKAVSSKIAYLQPSTVHIEELPRVAELLQTNVRQYFFRTEADIRTAVGRIVEDGCEVVVSGTNTGRTLCRKAGLPCVLLNTSRRTMVELVQRAQLLKEVRDREQAHQSQLQTTLNLVPDGVFHLDSENVVTVINRQGLAMLDLDGATDIRGKHISGFARSKAFLEIIDERRHQSGRVVEIAGKTLLLRSAPIFSKDVYHGAVVSLQHASEVANLEHRVRRQSLDSGMTAKAHFYDLEETTRSPEMRQCIERAMLYAKTNSTILIVGESGVGKELFAQSIHNASERRDQPFVAINCAALPRSLLESELFGYESGAFTGARRGGKPGYFEQAHKGALFLDEVGLLPLHVQMQLLRVLQERQVLRVGGRNTIPVDVRVIAATNADLARAVAGGSFREDLYYRINVLQIAIPPLRQRREDLEPLANHYIARYNVENHRRIVGCSDALLGALRDYDWPGNVRELCNYLMRLVLCSPGPTLTRKDLENADIRLAPRGEETRPAPPAPLAPAGGDDARLTLGPGSLRDLERAVVRWAMRRHAGNRKRVCEELGLSRTTLWKVLKALPKDPAPPEAS